MIKKEEIRALGRVFSDVIDLVKFGMICIDIIFFYL
ncbi:hypothetical protein BH23THE1_BH23THE1_27190 [soil metagenome]